MRCRETPTGQSIKEAPGRGGSWRGEQPASALGPARPRLRCTMSRAVLPLLLPLLLLGAFPPVRVQAQATVCTVCSAFKNGRCLGKEGNCTVSSSLGCRTKILSYFTEPGVWVQNHAELGCLPKCISEHMHYKNWKISTYCCKNQDFCNRYHEKLND